MRRITVLLLGSATFACASPPGTDAGRDAGTDASAIGTDATDPGTDAFAGTDASSYALLPGSDAQPTDCAMSGEPNTWTPTSALATPAPRRLHSAVWTGTEMIIWGGMDTNPPDCGSPCLIVPLGTGARYNPVLDTWMPTSTIAAPSPRYLQGAVWTGDEMIVWGGVDDPGWVRADGGRYDPATDLWLPMNDTGAPSARYTSLVWTGTEVVVWGGAGNLPPSLGDGARYDPATDGWSDMSAIGAPSPRAYAGGVWTGAQVLVWGGAEYSCLGCTPTFPSEGAAYDPLADSWTPLASADAPTGRSQFATYWTGGELVVWGGVTYAAAGTPYDLGGGVYSPEGVWSATPTMGEPLGREGITSVAVWTDAGAFIWGGFNSWVGLATLADGAVLAPGAWTWRPISAVGAPAGRFNHTAVWTGCEVIVWGGDGAMTSSVSLDTGGRWLP